MTVIWSMVHQMWSAMDRIFWHFRLFFSLLPTPLPTFPRPKNPKIQNLKKNEKNTWRCYQFKHVYNKWQSYDVWFLRYGAWQTELIVIFDCFLPFYPPNNPKNQNFEKLKKAPGDIIILHKCAKNHDHMLYCSLDMARNGFHCYFSFWAIFCSFNSLTAQKIKILIIWKKRLKISSFYNKAPRSWSYAILFLRYGAWRI